MWKEPRESMIVNAKAELAQVEAAIIMANNNGLGCHINISGLDIGICNNTKVIPALEHHKAEIEKFIRGEENEYE